MNPWLMERTSKVRAEELRRAACARSARSWHLNALALTRGSRPGLRVVVGCLLIRVGTRMSFGAHGYPAG
ncbi:MAG TPA: hypothetical protein VME20_11130 [Acidimicrobiales bacterium]|nr:hypothetical protein [Acidimicrobiales bacterium]